MEPMSNLMHIISKSQAPFIHIVLKDVIRVVEGIRVSDSLLVFNTVGTSENSLVIIEVVSISSVGRLKSFIVPSFVE